MERQVAARRSDGGRLKSAAAVHLGCVDVPLLPDGPHPLGPVGDPGVPATLLAEALDFPVMAVDHAGRIVLQNAAARSLLQNRAWRTVILADKRDGSTIVPSLCNLLLAKRSCVHRLVDSAREQVHALYVTPLPTAKAAYFLLAFKPDDVDRAWIHDTLKDVYGLTSSETAITLRLAAGKRVVNIARDRGTAIPTIRSQLRSIFRKTGMKTQQDLINMISTIPPLKHTIVRESRA